MAKPSRSSVAINPERDRVGVETLLGDIVAIESAYPGWVRTFAPKLKTAFERRLPERANQIARVWRVRDPRIRAALKVAAADTGLQDPKAAREAAKLEAICTALFEHHSTTVLTIETALWGNALGAGELVLWLAPLPETHREVIALAERLLCGEAPLSSVHTERMRRASRTPTTPARRSTVSVAPPKIDNLPAEAADPLDALIADEDRKQGAFDDALLDQLVNREEEYLDLLTRYWSLCMEAGEPLARLSETDEAIAQEMGITTGTVRVYRSTVLKKATGLRRAASD
jgi:hypothetical protein